MIKFNSIFQPRQFFYLIFSLIFSTNAKTDGFSLNNRCFDYYKKLTIISSDQESSLDEIITVLNNAPLSDEALKYIQNTNLPFQISPKTLSHILYGDYKLDGNDLILSGGLHTVEGFHRLLSLHVGLKDHFELNPLDIKTYKNGVTAIRFPQEIFPQQKTGLKHNTNKTNMKHFFPRDWDQLNIVKKIALVYRHFSNQKIFFQDSDRFKIKGRVNLGQNIIMKIDLIFFVDPLAPKDAKPTLISAYPSSDQTN